MKKVEKTRDVPPATNNESCMPVTPVHIAGSGYFLGTSLDIVPLTPLKDTPITVLSVKYCTYTRVVATFIDHEGNISDCTC